MLVTPGLNTFQIDLQTVEDRLTLFQNLAMQTIAPRNFIAGNRLTDNGNDAKNRVRQSLKGNSQKPDS
jgi:hypothetical protein